MTTPRRLSGIISKQMHSGKSECFMDETSVSRMPNGNTGDTYYNYEMHSPSSFYVRATNDVYTTIYLISFSLSPFSEATDVVREEAKSN